MNQKKHGDNKESLLTSAGMEMKVGGSDVEGQEGATEEGVNEEKQTEPKNEEKQINTEGCIFMRVGEFNNSVVGKYTS